MQIIPFYISTTGRSVASSLHVCTYRLFINAMPELFKSKYIISDHRQNGTEIILWKLIFVDDEKGELKKKTHFHIYELT